MNKTLLNVFLCAVSALPMTVAAQTTGTPSTTPGDDSAKAPAAAPGKALPAAPGSAAVPNATGTKVGTISIEQAIFASNEGQRDFEALSKKLEPKQTELKTQNEEIDTMKKKLNAEKLGDDERATLVKNIEDKQKKFERSVQDARDEAQNQQNEIAQRILQKMGPLIVKYAADNGFGLVIDTSNPWPNGPVLWSGGALDITKPVVEAYNTQSGVPAPAKPASAASKPTGTTKPKTTTAPPK